MSEHPKYITLETAKLLGCVFKKHMVDTDYLFRYDPGGVLMHSVSWHTDYMGVKIYGEWKPATGGVEKHVNDWPTKVYSCGRFIYVSAA